MYSSRSCVSNNVRLHNYSFFLSLLIFFRLYFSSLSLSLSFSRSRLFCPPLKPLSPLVFLSVKPILGLIEYQYFKHFESTTVHTISHSAFPRLALIEALSKCILISLLSNKLPHLYLPLIMCTCAWVDKSCKYKTLRKS